MSGSGIINKGTINANLSGGNLRILNGTFTNQGTINVGNSDTLTITSNWLNAGTFSVSGGTLTLNASTTQLGAINLSGGTLNLGSSFTTAQLGTITRTSGTVAVTSGGTLDNTGATLNVGTGTATLRSRWRQSSHS